LHLSSTIAYRSLRARAHLHGYFRVILQKIVELEAKVRELETQCDDLRCETASVCPMGAPGHAPAPSEVACSGMSRPVALVVAFADKRGIARLFLLS
jgi:hypothetical protein